MGKKDALTGEVRFELLEGKGLENQAPEVVIFYTQDQPEFIARAPAIAPDGTCMFMQQFQWTVQPQHNPVLTARVFDLNSGTQSGTINLDFRSLKNAPHVRDTWVPLEREPGRYVGSLHIRVTFLPERTVDLGGAREVKPAKETKSSGGLFSFGRKKKDDGPQYSTELFPPGYTAPPQTQAPLYFPPREAADPSAPTYRPAPAGPVGYSPPPVAAARPPPAPVGQMGPGYDPERDFVEPSSRSVLDMDDDVLSRAAPPPASSGLFSCWGAAPAAPAPAKPHKDFKEPVGCSAYFGALGRL